MVIRSIEEELRLVKPALDTMAKGLLKGRMCSLTWQDLANEAWMYIWQVRTGTTIKEDEGKFKKGKTRPNLYTSSLVLAKNKMMNVLKHEGVISKAESKLLDLREGRIDEPIEDNKG